MIKVKGYPHLYRDENTGAIVNYNDQELDDINRENALRTLGENYTEEQSREFLENAET